MNKQGKFIAVLGAGDYEPCKYYDDQATKYVQEAILRKHKEEIGEIIILGTDYSREKNWVSTNNESS